VRRKGRGRNEEEGNGKQEAKQESLQYGVAMMVFRIFRRLWRIGRWLVVGVLTLVLLLIIGIAIYSRTAHFHELLRAQLLAVLQNSLDAEVSFETTSGSIWQGLELRNLSIRKDGIEVGFATARGCVGRPLLASCRGSTDGVRASGEHHPVRTGDSSGARPGNRLECEPVDETN